ncbi:MAG: nuclear transport factor 2 family protein, partial [Pyrinomonadaceae bacterium]
MLIAAFAFVFNQPVGSTNQKGNDEQTIRQLLDELYAALGKNDTVALDRIYADDYTLVNELGAVTTKGPRLAAMKSGELKYESVSFDEANIRLYGNTAVATYRAMIKGQNKGQDIVGPLRVTVTLVKIKGRWQLVAAQATRIA